MLSTYRWCTRILRYVHKHPLGRRIAVTGASTRRCWPERRHASRRPPTRISVPTICPERQGCLLCRIFGLQQHQRHNRARGSTVSQHPSFYATPSGGRRPRHRRAHQQKRITRTTSILGLRGGAALLAREDLGRRAVLERRRVIGRRRREDVGHLRRPERERRASRRADHS